MRGLKREFPKEMVIGQSTWKVKWQRVIDEDPNCRGICDPETKTIVIALGLPKKQRVETFFHELLHAVEFEFGVRISHKLIYRLEGPLASVFQQNAWVTWAEWEEGA